jgi:hypothetical protein
MFFFIAFSFANGQSNTNLLDNECLRIKNLVESINKHDYTGIRNSCSFKLDQFENGYAYFINDEVVKACVIHEDLKVTFYYQSSNLIYASIESEGKSNPYLRYFISNRKLIKFSFVIGLPFIENYKDINPLLLKSDLVLSELKMK